MPIAANTEEVETHWQTRKALPPALRKIAPKKSTKTWPSR